MKLGALFLAAVSATTPCPSTDCWTFQEDLADGSKSCVLTPACAAVTCDFDMMIMKVKSGVFGTKENGDQELDGTGFDAAAPIGEFYEQKCSLGVPSVTSGENTYGLDQCPVATINGDDIVFTKPIHQVGGDRTRTRSDIIPEKQITLGNLVINTAPFGVGVDFTCNYPTSVSVTSADFEVKDVTITGTQTGIGSLDSGFDLVAGDGGTIILGSNLDISSTWSVNLSGFSFHFENCDVCHGCLNTPANTVAVIKDGCVANNLDVALLVTGVSDTISFLYKTFTIANEVATDQTISCGIKICADDSAGTAVNCAKTSDCTQIANYQQFGYQ